MYGLGAYVDCTQPYPSPGIQAPQHVLNCSDLLFLYHTSHLKIFQFIFWCFCNPALLSEDCSVSAFFFFLLDFLMLILYLNIWYFHDQKMLSFQHCSYLTVERSGQCYATSSSSRGRTIRQDCKFHGDSRQKYYILFFITVFSPPPIGSTQRQ